jgi:hypothetical protein
MERQELLDCLGEASDALGEFRHLLPRHSPAAQAQVDEARQHLDYAITLLQHAPRRRGDDPPQLRMAD